MWAFPWLTYVAIVAMVAVIAAMALVDDVRSQLIPSFLSLAVVLAAAWLRGRREPAADRAPIGRRRVPVT
jgi:L-asparagine transporter-like permease